MLGLLANNTSGPVAVELLRYAVPLGVGLASAAFLSFKISSNGGYSTDKSIPTVRIRSGDSTHDKEFNESSDEFLTMCEATYGPVFNLSIYGQKLTVVSAPLAREVFMSDGFSFTDALDDVSGVMTFMMSFVKSNRFDDNKMIHEVIRENLTPNLPLFTPRIVKHLTENVERDLGHCDHKLVKNPTLIMQNMIAQAMADVFMGSEIAKDPEVLTTFIDAAFDFGKVVQSGNNKDFWKNLSIKFKYGTGTSPMMKHVQVLVRAATPVVLERRRQEAEAAEKGVEWERPLDVLQKLLDSYDRYNFVDLEDICGQVLTLILASVHTTTDTSTNLLYYLACFPEHAQTLYEEQQRVINEQAAEREAQRQKKLDAGEVKFKQDFVGTDLDPEHDHDLAAPTVKKLVYMDSFVREVFRFRIDRLSLIHSARQSTTLSNGMTISKGSKAIVNIRSCHMNPDQVDEAPEFRPWRFVGKSKAATKASSDYLPFGMGKHACPGRFLAIQELKTVGAMMVARYSKIEMEKPEDRLKALLSQIGDPVDSGLYFTSRA
ncbi:hypothetical protein BGW38_001337 [Lunasporangiospora selenospora]|uniref:Cytochrome P450 n=1 Tax=Lunasporangiospora selenospora TaxID=979761 RepID=A0A9P6KEB5_9FUNG|nr:hypothetical protein BGW38_001337 [Lunasporangiospora selenospora]